MDQSIGGGGGGGFNQESRIHSRMKCNDVIGLTVVAAFYVFVAMAFSNFPYLFRTFTFEFGGVLFVWILPREILEVERSFIAVGNSCTPGYTSLTLFLPFERL